MILEWLRLYAEFATDPKVQSMPEAMQRRLIMLMCLRCGNVLETLQETDISFALRIDETQLAEMKALFVKKGFMDDDWNLLNWDKRQMPSDSSTARVREHRAKQKLLQEQASNVSVTAQSREEKKRKDKGNVASGEADPAKQVLTYLNETADRSFQQVDSSLKFIRARLGDGATVEQCKAVIDAKVAEWANNESMSQYLRPETLFNTTKFASYVGLLGSKGGDQKQSSGEKYL